MKLDVNTLFIVTLNVEVLLGLLLFFAWTQNFSKRALAWWGCAHLVRAVSIILFGLHGSVPNFISIDFANAALFGSFALTWSGARVFDGRRPSTAIALAGIAIWIAACRTPLFAASAELRGLTGAAIVTAYAWLTAYEFWRGRAETLVSRWPAIFILFAHGALFMLRTPLSASLHGVQVSDFAMSGWIELLSLEALLFTISIAFILLAMAKERTEHWHRTAARTDPLTGVANRRGFLEHAVLSKQRAAALQPTAVLLFDLDRFKSINDQHGHAVGDRVLRIFADIAKTYVGESGFIGRWGGDEFVAVLHDTTAERAAATAEIIKVTFENKAARIDSHAVNATVSVGMVFSEKGAFELPVLMLQADRALYRAKEDGRNRLVVAPPETAGADGEPASSDDEPMGRRSAA
jgi:diguanylate cyclase (GGDEF)-like protein